MFAWNNFEVKVKQRKVPAKRVLPSSPPQPPTVLPIATNDEESESIEVGFVDFTPESTVELSTEYLLRRQIEELKLQLEEKDAKIEELTTKLKESEAMVHELAPKSNSSDPPIVDHVMSTDEACKHYTS